MSKDKIYMGIGSSDNNFWCDLINFLNEYKTKDPNSVVIQMLGDTNPLKLKLKQESIKHRCVACQSENIIEIEDKV